MPWQTRCSWRRDSRQELDNGDDQLVKGLTGVGPAQESGLDVGEVSHQRVPAGLTHRGDQVGEVERVGRNVGHGLALGTPDLHRQIEAIVEVDS